MQKTAAGCEKSGRKNYQREQGRTGAPMHCMGKARSGRIEEGKKGVKKRRRAPGMWGEDGNGARLM